MFTGLVESLGEVVSLIPQPPGMRLVLRHDEFAAKAAIGGSIAINGCCLTVVALDGARLSFDVGDETLKRTNIGRLLAGERVNLEGSLRVGDQLGGHFVTGHIDAMGLVDERIDDNEWSTLWFRVQPHLTKQMASKGSVAVNGVSLTLVDVEVQRFSVMLIPHTLATTNLGALQVRDKVNIETDILAKYVEKQLASRSSP
jgi:riboflavin synthase